MGPERRHYLRPACRAINNKQTKNMNMLKYPQRQRRRPQIMVLIIK